MQRKSVGPVSGGSSFRLRGILWNCGPRTGLVLRILYLCLMRARAVPKRGIAFPLLTAFLASSACTATFSPRCAAITAPLLPHPACMPYFLYYATFAACLASSFPSAASCLFLLLTRTPAYITFCMHMLKHYIPFVSLPALLCHTFYSFYLFYLPLPGGVTNIVLATSSYVAGR